jgi:hypothetical protein
VRDNRPPTWLELESVIPLEAEPGVTSVETVTSLSSETIRRCYSQFVRQLSPKRRGMKLKHALQIAGTADIATPERVNPPKPKLAPHEGRPVVNVQLKGAP